MDNNKKCKNIIKYEFLALCLIPLAISWDGKSGKLSFELKNFASLA